MNSKIKTIVLLSVVGFLFVTTLYVSFLLRSGPETAPTTIKKTKASAITYSRTLALNTPTATIVISPTEAFIQGTSLISTISPTISPTESLSISPSPTETLIAKADISPTETLLAKVTSTPTVVVTKVKADVLPDAGWVKISHLVFVFAFSLVIFSLLY